VVFLIVVVCGAPLFLFCGARLSVLRTKRTLSSLPDAFRCNVRAIGGKPTASRRRWPRRTSHAVWLHDSLIVVDGVCRARVRPFAVRVAEGAVDTAPLGEVPGLGGHVVLMSLRLDDGTHVLVAAPESARALISGPYLAAQVMTPAQSSGESGKSA
jgi:hypothetical protein